MAEIGHPVVGDPVYRPASQPRCKASSTARPCTPRPSASATRSPARTSASRPPLPADLDALIVDLRNRYGIPGAGG